MLYGLVWTVDASYQPIARGPVLLVPCAASGEEGACTCSYQFTNEEDCLVSLFNVIATETGN